MKRILDKSNMTEEDWQNYREKQKGIGGSDVATILGLNPFKTAFTLWLEKTDQVEPSKVENDYVKWGNLLEPIIREQFARETGFLVEENPFVMQHDEHEFMLANIDGEVIDPQFGGERGILEIKTTKERNKNDWNDGVPNYYMLQVQHYLAVTNYNYAYIVVLIGGNEMRYFLIERDDYVIDKIITAEAEFWHMVQNNIAPEISGHSVDTEYLNNTYNEDNSEEGELPKDYSALCVRYVELQNEIKVLEEELNYIKNKIKLEAKDYKVLKNDFAKVSMPTIKKTIFNSKQFQEDHPDLYDSYKNKESSYRGFTVKLL